MAIFISLVLLAFSARTLLCVESKALKQHRMTDASDVCANVDEDLTASGPSDIPIDFGRIDECLCFSTVFAFAQTNSLAKAAVLTIGYDKTIEALNVMISGAVDSATCNYPPHTTPVCSASNPCSYTCASGYVSDPDNSGNCICASQPSRAAHRKRSQNLPGPDSCMPGWKPCGVLGNTRAWECVDIRNDLESCGGCTLPLDISAPMGVDCSDIPGVDSVSCAQGGCVVRSCMPGWRESASGSSCIEDCLFEPPLKITQLSHGLNDEESQIIEAMWAQLRHASSRLSFWEYK